MSEIDLSPEALQRRRDIAEKANQSRWTWDIEDGQSRIYGFKKILCRDVEEQDAIHIVVNDPRSVVAMIEEIERLREEIKKIKIGAKELAIQLSEACFHSGDSENCFCKGNCPCGYETMCRNGFYMQRQWLENAGIDD